MDCTKTLRLRIKDKHAQRAVCDGARGQSGLELLQRNQPPRHSRAAPVALGLRPAKADQRVQQVRWHPHRFAHGAASVRGLRQSAQAIQKSQTALAREQSPIAANTAWAGFRSKRGPCNTRLGKLPLPVRRFNLWDSYGLADYELRAGSFSQDTRGRWYLNVVVKVQPQATAGTASVGIDLGLKEAAAPPRANALRGAFTASWRHSWALRSGRTKSSA